MPQYSYDFPIGRNGQIASTMPLGVRSYINELLAQESDIDLAGFDAGTYTIRLTGEEGQFDITAVGAGATTLQIVTDLDTSATDNPDLVNVLVSTENDPTLELRFIHPGRTFDIALVSNPNGNMSHDLVQAAGGVDIELGVWLVQGSGDQLAKLPTGASVDAKFVGITSINTDSEVNFGSDTEKTKFPPKSVMSTLTMGDGYYTVEDAVTAGEPVFARITINAVGQSLGRSRSDVDGGAAVRISGAYYLTSTTGPGLAKIQVVRKGL